MRASYAVSSPLLMLATLIMGLAGVAGCDDRRLVYPPGCEHPAVVERCVDGWCEIPAGCYTNWVTPPVLWDLSGRSKDGLNSRPRFIRLTHAFIIQQTETMRGDFQRRMGYEPSPQGHGVSPKLPVPATWYEAAAYCNALSKEKGAPACYRCRGTTWRDLRCEVAPAYAGSAIYDCSGYRLPTRAEWRYAYRAGTLTYFYSGTPNLLGDYSPLADLIGWYGEEHGLPHPPAQKMKNAWGLYDMAGNLKEWGHDPGSEWDEHSNGIYPKGYEGPDPSIPPDVDPVSPVWNHTSYHIPYAPAMGGAVTDRAEQLGYRSHKLEIKENGTCTVRCVRSRLSTPR
ncbi:MAG: SUMF1/EgtB/PvdO family nonheme iron enzyme [Deltaproteobacteria bacterium]|nr:SUMF1/EgtB/PvdO family nonheme iron enzyme [Deltaproteobacteria bacterium]